MDQTVVTKLLKKYFDCIRLLLTDVWPVDFPEYDVINDTKVFSEEIRSLRAYFGSDIKLVMNNELKERAVVPSIEAEDITRHILLTSPEGNSSVVRQPLVKLHRLNTANLGLNANLKERVDVMGNELKNIMSSKRKSVVQQVKPLIKVQRLSTEKLVSPVKKSSKRRSVVRLLKPMVKLKRIDPENLALNTDLQERFIHPVIPTPPKPVARQVIPIIKMHRLDMETLTINADLQARGTNKPRNEMKSVIHAVTPKRKSKLKPVAKLQPFNTENEDIVELTTIMRERSELHKVENSPTKEIIPPSEKIKQMKTEQNGNKESKDPKSLSDGCNIQ